MNSKIKGVLGAAILTLAVIPQTFAIDGLTLSLQCSNVVLSWPSTPGENYIVQYRPTLATNTSWITLTSSWPADWSATTTTFVHSNILQYPNCGGSGYSALATGNSVVPSNPVIDNSPTLMVVPANGSSPAVPLWLYPPGADLTGFVIYDPVTEESQSGNGYVVTSPVTLGSNDSDMPIPGGDQPNGVGGSALYASDLGFYQVVRIGVDVEHDDYTNGPFSGTINFRFEAGNPLGTLQDVSVLVDGTPYRGAPALVAPGINGHLIVDTAYLENGEHTFQVQASWLDLDASNPNQAAMSQWSMPFTLTISNVVYYPDWVEEIGELGSTLFTASTIYTDADWQFDIYDIRGDFVQSLLGHTTNGTIEAYWDLVDANGVTRTNLDYDPEFDSVLTVGNSQNSQSKKDGTGKKGQKKRPVAAYPDHGRWAIAYQDTFVHMVNSNNYYNAIYTMGAIGAEISGAVTVFPTYPTNGQTFPLRYPSTNNPVTMATMLLDQHALETLLTNKLNRNFYYNGHSNPQSFAGSLNASWLSYIVKERNHYYRFVFLDSCLSATGGLPAGFGIGFSSPVGIEYFQRQKIRPRAFVGYGNAPNYCYTGIYVDPSTGQTAYGLVPEEVYEFLGNFQFYWYFNYDLVTALYYAIRDTPYIGPGWQTGEELRIYGYSGLRIDQFNSQTDWSN